MNTITGELGFREACTALGFARATFMRHRKEPRPKRPLLTSRPSHRALSQTQRQVIRDTMHCERFADRSVREVYAMLLDEGRYIGSISTIYRTLRAMGETRERRRQATHPATVKPELVATAPRRLRAVCT